MLISDKDAAKIMSMLEKPNTILRILANESGDQFTQSLNFLIP
jgi:hypothetical protein